MQVYAIVLLVFVVSNLKSVSLNSITFCWLDKKLTKDVDLIMKLLLRKTFQAFGITLLILGSICVLFGCSASHRSYEIEVVSSVNNIQPNQQVEIVYKIKDNQGNIVKDFDVMNEKIMHFIITRKDLQYFQHLHPEFDKATGEFSIAVTFTTDGEYRMFADFTPSTSQIGTNGERLPVIAYKDVNVGNLANYKPKPTENTDRTKIFNNYTITITPDSEPISSQNNIEFTFEIRKDGKLTTNLEKYLGALGHTVVLREGDLQFIHAHPTKSPDVQQTGKVAFMITFPKAGNYKLFSQFQHEGKIITSDFLIHVIEGSKNSPNDMMMHEGMKK